ncbi:MAG: cysteine-rich CWC family protein [Myxococcaceae bacterium]|jgi:hypothetical protein|nr:cysteine-rich CWC family protein [Myxococcaceae bacterium]MCA3014417.1 cysteine-rich CWC family protein [Myxococcaceae bacterium]
MDPMRCPSCQRPNDCAVAAGRTSCWCFQVTIDPAALAALPPEAKRACLCRACGVEGWSRAKPPQTHR